MVLNNTSDKAPIEPINQKLRILVTAPPFVHMREELESLVEKFTFEVSWSSSLQQLTEEELISQLAKYDGWILGDDPCSEAVISAGRRGKLKAIVKWGVGVDNVDFKALDELGIAFKNTPGVFGKEVADLAMGYLISLFRGIIPVHSSTSMGNWLKWRGSSLENKKVGVVGYGSIGKNLVKRLLAADVEVYVYEINSNVLNDSTDFIVRSWPDGVNQLDAIILACPLTRENQYMINKNVISKMKQSCYIINMSRGKLIREKDLAKALIAGDLSGAALDVFEEEPLPRISPLRDCKNIIFGSHNGSNTIEAVTRTSLMTLGLMQELLRVKHRDP